jgi:hypothetical protein
VPRVYAVCREDFAAEVARSKIALASGNFECSIAETLFRSPQPEIPSFCKKRKRMGCPPRFLNRKEWANLPTLS